MYLIRKKDNSALFLSKTDYWEGFADAQEFPDNSGDLPEGGEWLEFNREEFNSFLEEFIAGYITCAIWSAPEEDDGSNLDEYDSSDIAPDAMESIRSDCEDFVSAQWSDLQAYAEKMNRPQQWTGAEMAGHDFSLTRNGHGAGFWDRGLGELGDRLSKAAKVYGTATLYLGDDGKLYEMN